MKMFVVLALAALAAAEPEADPQLLLGGIHGVHTPYTHVAPVSTYSSPLLRTLVNPIQSIIPAVRTVVPDVKTVLSTPVVSTYSQYPYGVGYPMTYGAHPYGVIAAPTKIVTNYKDSEHYTAEATPLGKALGEPSYVAKNGEVVHEVQKREAEADPAFFYSGLTHTPTVYNNGVVRPINYASSAIRPISYASSVVNPINYNYGVPAVSYRSPFVGGYSALSHMIHKREAEADPALFYSGLTHTPTVYNTGVVRPFSYASSAIRPISYASSVVNPINYNYGVPAVSYRSPFVGGYSALSHMIHKREAEADPALFYSGLTHTPFTGINSVYNTAGVINPFTYTYNTAAVNPVVYNTPAVVNPVVYNAAIVKAHDHGIAATPFGAVHSSHVGKCLNNEGAEVPC